MGLDGFTARPNGRASFRVVDTLATCGWCTRRVDVVPDPAAGLNRCAEHRRPGERCPGSGQPVGSSPATVYLDWLLAQAGDR